jgi:alkanesulfonate monooxygenase SsuD/methylene tetrahydromethanopterin reductase-like flavin-dependent oxidoreductase (luciferase family)
MDFGLQWFPRQQRGVDRLHYYRDILERLPPEFSTIWVNDHLQFGSEEQLEGWTLLTFLAGAHPRFHFGHLVLSQSFRNPALLAKMAATLHDLTGGKFILGLGAGWHEEEYRAYGYEYPRPGTRIAQLAEAITLIRTLWSESPATFRGTYYTIDRAYCEPRPDRPIPILVGTGRRNGLRLAAQFANMWNWDGPLEPAYRAPLELLRAQCVDIGRPVGEISLTAGIEVSLPENVSTYVPWLDTPSGDRVYRLGPTASDVIREIRLLEAEGVSHVQVAVDNVASLDRFIAEVVPAFRA